MKCPKCGNEIKDGHLYCGVCGEEIRIVPDFDVDTDENIKISITDVIDTDKILDGLSESSTKEIVKEIDKEATKEINIKDSASKSGKNDKTSEDAYEPDNKSITKALVIAGAICVVVAIIVILINRSVNEYYSSDKQYEKAFDQFENGQYNDSIKTVKHAISINPDDARLYMLLADSYYMLGKYDESNAVLFELLEQYKDDAGIIDKIVTNYEAMGDTQAINKLLTEEVDEDASKPFAEYIVEAVTFSHPDGVYEQELELGMYSNEGSTIYYTLDGTDVTTSSNVYSEPVILGSGEYTINAFAVNSKGVESPVSTAKYEINFEKPDMPVLKTGTGMYNTPKTVEVEVPEYDACYYTIDGDNPTVDDERYQGPIPMYIGTHTYKFAVISTKGVSSDVVSVEISLDLITLVDMETVTNNLIAWINATGKGNTDYSYVCEQACENNGSIYYIINEYKKTDSDGEQLTGNHYAVDVLTGITYRAKLDKQTGKYTLEVLI